MRPLIWTFLLMAVAVIVAIVWGCCMASSRADREIARILRAEREPGGQRGRRP